LQFLPIVQKSYRGPSGTIGVRLHGREFLGAMSTLNAVTNTFNQLFGVAFSPICFPGTRLYILAQTWQKFRFNKIIFHYVPACSTATNGNMILGSFDDIDFTTGAQYTNTLSFAQALLSTNKAVITPYWNKYSYEWVPAPNTQDYFITPDTTGDDRLCVQGQFMTMDGGTGSSTYQSQLGSIWMEYDITFHSPALDPFTWNNYNFTLSTSGGLSSVMQLYINPSTSPFNTSATTQWALSVTQKLGYLQPGVVYYVTTSGSTQTNFTIYTSPAQTQAVAGNWNAVSDIISTLYKPSNTLSGPVLAKYKDLEDLRIREEKLEDLFQRFCTDDPMETVSTSSSSSTSELTKSFRPIVRDSYVTPRR